jgi:hypothetical protein
MSGIIRSVFLFTLIHIIYAPPSGGTCAELYHAHTTVNTHRVLGKYDRIYCVIRVTTTNKIHFNGDENGSEPRSRGLVTLTGLWNSENRDFRPSIPDTKNPKWR